jgi:hypothetical protein
MKPVCLTTAFCLVLVLAGCENEGKYPISGQECDPGDPVQSMGESDCIMPSTVGSGTF